jgi:hypothetical protein
MFTHENNLYPSILITFFLYATKIRKNIYIAIIMLLHYVSELLPYINLFLQVFYKQISSPTVA